MTKKTQLPRAEWAVLIHDHHPAYISWDAFLANGTRLAANHTAKGQRPAREGSAICQGIVSCGSCGRTMGTHYQRGTVGYKCSRSHLEHLNTPGCREVKTQVVDELVTERLLANQVRVARAHTRGRGPGGARRAGRGPNRAGHRAFAGTRQRRHRRAARRSPDRLGADACRRRGGRPGARRERSDTRGHECLARSPQRAAAPRRDRTSRGICAAGPAGR